MRNYTIAEIEAICNRLVVNIGEPRKPMGVPFLDCRLDVYQELWKGGHAYYSVLRAIAQELKPSTVLEVGTWQGTSAACFADGCAEATVMTIDHHSDMPGDGINQARTLEACQQYPNMFYIQGCSTEMVLKEKPESRFVKPIVVEQLAGRTIDIFFIDGWHGGLYAKADYDTYAELLSENALIICDDLCGGDGPTIFGMTKFFEGIQGVERYMDGGIHPGYPVGFVKHGSK